MTSVKTYPDLIKRILILIFCRYVCFEILHKMSRQKLFIFTLSIDKSFVMVYNGSIIRNKTHSIKFQERISWIAEKTTIIVEVHTSFLRNTEVDVGVLRPFLKKGWYAFLRYNKSHLPQTAFILTLCFVNHYFFISD